MNYRDFGKTGEKISALGFGCMRFPEYKEGEKNFVDQEKVDEMIRYAYENGVNYFDTAPYYCNSNSEAALGHAVKDFRDKILISTKCPMDAGMGEAGYRAHLERSLTRMGTDHIDFYHFWGINRGTFDNLIMKEGLLEAAAKAKEEGLIRHISFSFHDHPSAIKHIVDTAEAQGVKMESMLCQYNLLDRSNEEMIKYVNEKGLGTVAMGPVGGGRLAAPTDLYEKLTGKPSIATYELAFKFCLGNPNLNCALSGMQNLDMVQKNIKVASDDTAFSEEEWNALGVAMEEIKKQLTCSERTTYKLYSLDNNYCLFLASMHFATIDDFINLELCTPRAKNNMSKFFYNPIPLDDINVMSISDCFVATSFEIPNQQ